MSEIDRLLLKAYPHMDLSLRLQTAKYSYYKVGRIHIRFTLLA
jgi:hypothetical protein